MNLFKLSQIITKHLRSQASDDEESVLKKWVQDDSKKQEFLKGLKDESSLIRDLIEYNRYDVSRAWNRFEGNSKLEVKKRNLLLPLLKVAAVAILFISIGLAVYILTDVSVTNPKLSHSITPGVSGAILHVDDQDVIELTDSVTTEVKNNKGLIAKVEAGQLSYGDNVDPVQMTVEVPLRSEFQFVLSDGTKVWMNAGSKVNFMHPFNGDKREIYAEGEVFLDVEKDKLRPFLVTLPTSNAIEVLGTQFNIKAYPDENIQQTVLVEGSILWRSNNGKERIIEPGQLLQADNSTNQINVNTVDVYPHIAWKEGYFVYEGETLENIMQSLCRWYGVEVDYQEEVIKDLHFSVDVRRYSDLNEILSMLQITEKVYFEINGSNILVSKHK